MERRFTYRSIPTKPPSKRTRRGGSMPERLPDIVYERKRRNKKSCSSLGKPYQVTRSKSKLWHPTANLPFSIDYCSKERHAKRQRTDEESRGNSSSNPPKLLQAGHPGFKSEKCAPYLAKSDYLVDASGKQQRAGQDIGLIRVSDGATNLVTHLPPIWEVVQGSQMLQVQKILTWPA